MWVLFDLDVATVCLCCFCLCVCLFYLFCLALFLFGFVFFDFVSVEASIPTGKYVLFLKTITSVFPFFHFPTIPPPFFEWKWKSLILERGQFYTLYFISFFTQNINFYRNKIQPSHWTKKLWQHLRYGVYSVCNLLPWSASGNHHWQ